MPIITGCLGRLDHDQSRVDAASGYTMENPYRFSTADRGGVKWTPSLVRNDVLGTCAIAGLINSARYWALLHGFDLTNYQANELMLYARLGGAPWPATDSQLSAIPGMVLMDLLEDVAGKGFNVGAQAPLVLEFGVLRGLTIAQVVDSIMTEGSAYVGVRLYEADMQPGAVWQGGTAKAGAVVGGHCLLPFDRAPGPAGEFSIATWGGITQSDDEWLLSRMDEAYGLRWKFPVVA